MSEEVLKALMQLFAIIANQDSGSGVMHIEYVQSFLKSQVRDDRTREFTEYFTEFLKPPSETEDSAKRTSVKDSVRTLAICKKINKTLSQKQKVIVFVRLFEFVIQDGDKRGSREAILKTVADVFKISKEEYNLIENIFSNETHLLNSDFLIIHDNNRDNLKCRQLAVNGFSGSCIFHLVRETNIIFFIYHGHSEIILNGIPVQSSKINVLSPGSSIRHPLGTLFYSDIINEFLGESFENLISFQAEIKWHLHPNGKIALHEFGINEKSGTLCGIMGASGSGKTTLLNVLSGIDDLTEGQVTVNGKDLKLNKVEISGAYGFIPQDDLLIEELTVYENLFLNAKLCFRSIGDKELNIKVIKLLNALGLHDAKDVKVGSPLNKKISGGQRKRLNIALELIREPQILFIDEPTSGLSSRDSENVMDLLKELSHKGKLIFVVIHQPSSDIYKLFDRILILDTGGFPTYYGNPIEALLYFKKTSNQINSDTAVCSSCGSVNPELIFNLIEAKEIDEYGNYTEKRKITPDGWYKLFQNNFRNNNTRIETADAPLSPLKVAGKFKQWQIFFLRDFLSKISNHQYVLINLLEVPLLSFFLAILIRYINKGDGATGHYSYYNNENIPAYYFMSIIVALLVGLTISAEEIYKDQKVLKRERFLNLSRFSYLSSKIIILFGISAVQTVFLCLIGFLVLEIPSGFWQFYLTIFSVFCSANLMGLVLSSTFNSPVTIYIIIPLIIIPQMLLGGAMFKFSRLNDYLGGSLTDVPQISNLMVSRWAYEGIAVHMYKANEYEQELFATKKLASELNYRVSYLIPKLEELIDYRKRMDSTQFGGHKELVSKVISRTLKAEFQRATITYDMPEFPYSEDSLSWYKSFIINKYNQAVDLEEDQTILLNNAGITKSLHTNKNLTDLVTNSLEKTKIVIDTSNSLITQTIDPIYMDPSESKGSGISSHFYSPFKLILEKKITTFSYNLCMIWMLNLLAFILLYFDLLKKIIKSFDLISLRR